MPMRVRGNCLNVGNVFCENVKGKKTKCDNDTTKLKGRTSDLGEEKRENQHVKTPKEALVGANKGRFSACLRERDSMKVCNRFKHSGMTSGA